MKNILFYMLFLLACTSCKKYLEQKPDQSVATPSTLDDLQNIIDNYGVLNARFSAIPELSADNFYLTDASWNTLSDLHRNLYHWQKYDDIPGDWSVPYNNIYYTNLVLETLPRVITVVTEQQRADFIKGAAFFVRAYNYYALAQLFTPPFENSTAETSMGLPLRLNTNINERSVRASLLQTWQQIIADLKASLPLLPAMPPVKYRPSKPAAYAALARTYMCMQDYEMAGFYADSCLKLYDSLMDYNTINAAAAIPFAQFNREVIYETRTNSISAMSQSNAKIDSGLYQSYASNDLRKSVFFRSNGNGTYAFKGNYTGQSAAYLFTGVATDEMYLLRAECYARAGNTTAALADLNTLMSKRWKAGTFVPFTASDANEALLLILKERRKELLFRNLRWTDLRRLNKEPAWAQTITRVLNNQVYSLEPDSWRYTLQIDREAILFSGMQQNP